MWKGPWTVSIPRILKIPPYTSSDYSSLEFVGQMVENFDINFWNVEKKIGKDKTFKTRNPPLKQRTHYPMHLIPPINPLTSANVSSRNPYDWKWEQIVRIF